MEGILAKAYVELGHKLDSSGQPLGLTLLETFGVNHKYVIKYEDLDIERMSFKDSLSAYDWVGRQDMEMLHYNKLRFGLSHSFAENWFYKKEWIEDTRRVIVTSTDCISSISLYIRDGQMMISVYFRSSHYDNLLPVDLSFITGLPYFFMADLRHVVDTFEIPHVFPEISVVNFDLSFGNLHRTNTVEATALPVGP